MRKMIVNENHEEHTIEFAGGPNRTEASLRFIVVSIKRGDTKSIGFFDTNWAKTMMASVKAKTSTMTDTNLTSEDFHHAINVLDSSTIDHIRNKLNKEPENFPSVLGKRKQGQEAPVQQLCNYDKDQNDESEEEEKITKVIRTRKKKKLEEKEKGRSSSMRSTDEPKSKATSSMNKAQLAARLEDALAQRDARDQQIIDVKDELSRLRRQISSSASSSMVIDEGPRPAAPNPTNAIMNSSNAPMLAANNPFASMMMMMSNSSQQSRPWGQPISQHNSDMQVMAMSSMFNSAMQAFNGIGQYR